MGGVGRAGEDMARQQKERVAGEGEMRGRYGAGGVARGMAQAGKMRLRNLFGRFFFIYFRICYLSIFSLKYKQLKKLTGEENC